MLQVRLIGQSSNQLRFKLRLNQVHEQVAEPVEVFTGHAPSVTVRVTVSQVAVQAQLTG
jgi:hypothetical protein